jgi:uncharacterized protein (TIGR02246 family)
MKMQQSAAAQGGEIKGADHLTAEDRLDIHQLIAEYSHYEDNGDAASWGALYTADGRFVGSGGDKEIIGRDNLVEFARRRWADKPQVRKWIHWVSNVTIRGTADGAASQSFQMTVEAQADGGYRIVKLSAKSDELRREDGKWRFHVRRVVPLPFE